MKIIQNNKKAYFEYFIEDTFEAGIVLKGSEVKSVKNGHMSIVDSFVSIKDNEVFLKNAYIKPYEKANNFAPDEKRIRKLLLNKIEIEKIKKKVETKGYTLVPTKVYLKDNLVKVEIGVARGKKLYDKRETIKERELNRRIKQEVVL
ncbi:MAG: SsrA-binding protein SmpB [Clostridiales bacterium]|nr:SsrA-binding protein SmpB [Clostridiales bacterium]